MSEQLKPCPFCGGEPETVRCKNAYKIECKGCNAMMGRGAKAFSWARGYLSFENKEDAVKAWNTRKSNINPNLIKALRCLASQDAFKECYVDRYNKELVHSKRMTCKPLPDNLSIPCPYHQDEFITKCEDGDCMEWLSEIAYILEGVDKDNDNTKSN